MQRFRFHIGTLVILVLVLGVSFAALRESNEIWESVVFTLTVAVLTTSVLLAVHRSEKRRAFWFGFALFGTTYLALSSTPSIESRLITTKALTYIDSKVRRSAQVGYAYFDYDTDGDMDLYVVNKAQPSALYVNNGNGTFQDVTTTVGLNSGTTNTHLFNSPGGLWTFSTSENFVRIGHSLCALIVGLIGGQLSRHLRNNNR
jgi:hypothetical protein